MNSDHVKALRAKREQDSKDRRSVTNQRFKVHDLSKYLQHVNKEGSVNAMGYVRLRITTPSGRVEILKHRLVLYKKIGAGEHPCHHCGKIVSWDAHHIAEPDRALVADHLDENKLNNAPVNLVPSCNQCNATRSTEKAKAAQESYWRQAGPTQYERTLTYKGET